jgi:hypothetical protein
VAHPAISSSNINNTIIIFFIFIPYLDPIQVIFNMESTAALALSEVSNPTAVVLPPNPALAEKQNLKPDTPPPDVALHWHNGGALNVPGAKLTV